MKRLRKVLGLTQAGLGEALDLNKNTVARAERDEIPIHKTTAMAIQYLLVMESKQKRKNKHGRRR